MTTHEIVWRGRAVKCTCGWKPVGPMNRYDSQRAALAHIAAVSS